MIDFHKPRSQAAQDVADRRYADEDGDGLSFREIELVAPGGGDSSITGLNDMFGGALVAVVLLSGVTIASTRPVLWLMWSAVIAVMFAVYFALVARRAPGREISMKHQWLLMLLGLSMPVFGLAQAYLSGPFALGEVRGVVDLRAATFDRGATLLAVIRTLAMVAFFGLALEVSSRARRIEKMAWGLFAGVALHAVWALIALLFLGDISYWGAKSSYAGSATGTFINRNSFATFLGIGLVLGIALTMNRANRPHLRMPRGSHLMSERNLEQIALWIVVAIVAVTLILTQSRMGTVASFVGALIVTFLMTAKSAAGLSRAASRTAVIFALGALAATGVFGGALVDRGLDVVRSGQLRGDLYQQVFGMIRDHPLLGIGLDAFATAYETVHAPPVSALVTWDLPHSTYLTLWSELGIVIGSLPMIAFAIAVWRLVVILRRRSNSYTLTAAALAASAIVAIHSFVDFSLEIPAVLMMFLLVLAMGLGRLRRDGGQA